MSTLISDGASSPPRKVGKYEMEMEVGAGDADSMKFHQRRRTTSASWPAVLRADADCDYAGKAPREFSAVWSELRSKGELCDCEIESGDGHVYAAHRVILAGVSPYFKVLFTSSLSSKRQRLEMPEASGGLVGLILDYAYTGRCRALGAENVEGLLILADRFELLGLVRLCSDFLAERLRPENCLGIRKFAQHYFCQGLERRSRGYVRRHFEQIVRGPAGRAGVDEFCQLECDEVEAMLRDDELNAPREELVFEAVRLWVEARPGERSGRLAARLLWACPRYGLMPRRFLEEAVLGWSGTLPRPRDGHPARQPGDLDRLEAALRRGPTWRAEWRRPRAPHELLLLLGGWAAGALSSLVETFDGRAERWRPRPEWAAASGPRAYHGLCCLPEEDGARLRVYLCGGYDGRRILNALRCFALAGDGQLAEHQRLEWRERACMYEARCYLSLCALGGRLYALGGNNGLARLRSCERYEPAQNQWQLIAPMRRERSDASAAALGGCLYVAGGYDGRSILDSLELYDPAADQWTSLLHLPSMRSPRTGLCLVAFRHWLYAIGGFDGYRRLASVERLDCRRRGDGWQRLPDMTHARSNLAAAVLDGSSDGSRIVAIGGYDGSQPVAHVEAYSAELGRWCDLPPIITARSALAVCVLALPPSLPRPV